MAELTGQEISIDSTLDDLIEQTHEETTGEQFNAARFTMEEPLDPQTVDSVIDQAIDEVDAPLNLQRPRGATPEALQFADGISTMDEIRTKSSASRVADMTGMTPEMAEMELLNATPDQLKARSRQQEISDYYPSLAQWGSDPDNYVLINNDVEALQGISTRARDLDPVRRSNFEKAVKRGTLSYDRAAILMGMSMGLIDPKKASYALRYLDDELDKTRFTMDANL